MAERKVTLVCAWANGFDESGNFDVFSLRALQRAVELFQELQSRGDPVRFVMANCVVRSLQGRQLGEEWRRLLIRTGVREEDIDVSDLPAHNLPTDATSIINFMTKHRPGARLEGMMFAGPPVASYVEETYQACARHIFDRRIEIHISWPDNAPEPKLRARIIYACLWRLTQLMSTSRRLFLFYYRVRNWWDRRRLEEFTRTVR